MSRFTKPSAVRRRVVASAAALVGAGTLALGVGVPAAHADGGLPDCIHGALRRTVMGTVLLANDARTSGTVVNQWLYRSNGRQWVYTGVSTGARSYAGGIWMSGGRQVSELDFSLSPGSGYYIVLEQIARPGQQPYTFWQNYYRTEDNVYYGYCEA